MNYLKQYLPAAAAILICGLILWRVPINGLGSLVWLVGSVVMAAIRRPHEKINAANITTRSKQDWMENLLLAGVFLGGLILPVAHLITGVFSDLNYQVYDFVWIFASVLFTFGIWLFWRSHVDLGKNWNVSLHVREGHNLTTGGVYKRIRHPMYASIFIVYLAQALLIQNWLAGCAGIISFILLYWIRVPKEEAMMLEEFGEAYTEFCQTRGRILPKWNK